MKPTQLSSPKTIDEETSYAYADADADVDADAEKECSCVVYFRGAGYRRKPYALLRNSRRGALNWGKAVGFGLPLSQLFVNTSCA